MPQLWHHGGVGVTLHPTIGTDTKVAKPRIVYSYKKKSAPITHLEWTADGCSQLLAVNAKGRVRNRQVPLCSRWLAHDLALSCALFPLTSPPRSLSLDLFTPPPPDHCAHTAPLEARQGPGCHPRCRGQGKA